MKTYSKFMEESYTLYHPSYTSAINAALQKHSDLNVSDEDRDTHIAMGPRKPAEGETVKHHIPATDKNGDKHMIHIQVYNKGGNKPFELNTYSSKKGVSFSSVSKKKVAEETVDVSEGLGDRYTNDPIGNFSGLKAHAKKLGSKHKDYDDLMVAASHMAFGNKDHLNKHIEKLDTDVRDKVKEYMKEEAEHIDELSKKTLGSYVKKAEYQKNALIGFGMIDAIHHSGKNERKIMNKFKNRAYGIDKAANKLSGQAKVNANEEADQIDEISSATLVSYSQKAHDQIKGNQPAEPDKLRKRTNREQGIKLAFNKHYQVRTKVPATIKEEEEPLAEISAALAMRASRAATKEVGMGKSNREDKLIGLQKTADEKFRKMLGRSSSAKVATTSEETVLDEVSKGTVGSYLEKLNTLKRSELKARGTKPTLAVNKVFGKDVKVPATDE